MKKFTGKNKSSFVLLIFLIFQLVIFFNFAIGAKIIPTKGDFTYADSSQQPKFFWNRANFDGVHYLSIAQKGFGLYQQAFFPLYPKIIRFLGKILGGQYLLAGFLISSFSTLGTLFIFYKLIKIDFSQKTAKKALIYLLVFPTSFYLVAVYTEALFLFLILLSFWWARKGKWGLVPLGVTLASATRLVGIFLLPALVFELWQQEKKGQKLKVGFCILLVWQFLISPLGLLLFANYLNREFNDPLMFVHVQPYFGAQRTGGKIILLYQVFWRYLKMVVTCQKNSLLYFNVWLELLVSLLFLSLLFLAYRKKINSSYLIFSVLAYLAPTLTGTFSSLPRYVLVLFPCFIALAQFLKKYPWLQKVYLLVSVALFFICQFLFSQGYWVS